jgi:hypothetical protein
VSPPDVDQLIGWFALCLGTLVLALMAWGLIS